MRDVLLPAVLRGEARPADVATLRAELSARDQAIVSLKAKLTGKDAEIATLIGQAKTTDRRAQELAASFGSGPAAKDNATARGAADDGAAHYRQYQALMRAGKGREAANFWAKHETSILAYGETLQESEP